MSHDFFRNCLLLLCDVTFSPFLVALPRIFCQALWQSDWCHCSTEKIREETPPARPPLASHHTPMSLRALPLAQRCTLCKHLGERNISAPCCVYFTSQIHTLSKRGEECLALLRWLSGRSTTPFSGNSIGVLEQLFQFLIQALEMEDQVTFLSSHQC